MDGIKKFEMRQQYIPVIHSEVKFHLFDQLFHFSKWSSEDKALVILFLNPFPNKLLFLHVCSSSLLGKFCGKSRNCWQRAISPFSTTFSTLSENFPPFLSNLKLSSAISQSLKESKICRLGKG